MLLLVSLVGAWAGEDLPLEYSARRPTLPRMGVRLDADTTVIPLVPARMTAVDFTGGFAVGVTPELEVGALLLPIGFAPELRYEAPSLYAKYAGHASDEITLGPSLRVFAPVIEGPGPMLDAGLSARIGASSGHLEMGAVTNVAFEEEIEQSFGFPVTLVMQPHERFFVSLSSGASSDPMDVRFSAPRADREDGVLYVPAGGGLGGTFGDADHTLTDLTANIYLPEVLKYDTGSWYLDRGYTFLIRLTSTIPGEPQVYRGAW
jgi:hypothetical protein